MKRAGLGLLGMGAVAVVGAAFSLLVLRAAPAPTPGAAQPVAGDTSAGSAAVTTARPTAPARPLRPGAGRLPADARRASAEPASLPEAAVDRDGRDWQPSPEDLSDPARYAEREAEWRGREREYMKDGFDARIELVEDAIRQAERRGERSPEELGEAREALAALRFGRAHLDGEPPAEPPLRDAGAAQP